MSPLVYAVLAVSALLGGWWSWRQATQSFSRPWAVAQPTDMSKRERARWVRATRKRERLRATVLGAVMGATIGFAFLFVVSMISGGPSR
jgi:hypothetical protein